jgi:hypothetical protein
MAQKKITDEQLQEELNAGMKNIDIARKYGISDRVIRIRKAKLAKKGVGHGRDVSHLVPDGYKIKGTSSLVDEYGNTKLQWVKTDTDAERQVELMKAVVDDDGIKMYPREQLRWSDLVAYSTVSGQNIGMFESDIIMSLAAMSPKELPKASARFVAYCSLIALSAA